MSAITTVQLLTSVTTVSVGTVEANSSSKKTFHANGVMSAAAGAATIKVQGTNIAAPGVNDWIDLGTITLSLTTTSSCDGFVVDAPWFKVRGNVTAITANGTVNLFMNHEG